MRVGLGPKARSEAAQRHLRVAFQHNTEFSVKVSEGDMGKGWFPSTLPIPILHQKTNSSSQGCVLDNHNSNFLATRERPRRSSGLVGVLRVEHKDDNCRGQGADELT